jgi:hypothetical protein
MAAKRPKEDEERPEAVHVSLINFAPGSDVRSIIRHIGGLPQEAQDRVALVQMKGSVFADMGSEQMLMAYHIENVYPTSGNLYVGNATPPPGEYYILCISENARFVCSAITVAGLKRAFEQTYTVSPSDIPLTYPDSK